MDSWLSNVDHLPDCTDPKKRGENDEFYNCELYTASSRWWRLRDLRDLVSDV